MARTKRVSKARKGGIKGKGRRVQSKRMSKKRTKRSSKSSSRSNKRMRRSFIKKSRGRPRRSLRMMRGGVSGNVTIQDITSKKFILTTDSNKTIAHLKQMIVNDDTWDFDDTTQFRLTLNGENQTDDKNVVIGSTYMLILRLPPDHPNANPD